MKKYLVLPLVLFLSLTGQMCGSPAEEVPTEPEVVVDEPQLDYYVVTNEAQSLQLAKDRFSVAFAKAQEWQTEVDLMLVSVSFVNEFSDEGAYDRFLFSSDLDPDLYFSIDILRSDPEVYTRSLIYRDDYVIKSDVKPIPIKYWNMSVEKTLELVDSQGGAEFRANNPDFKVEMLLSLAGGTNLAWYVVYSAPGATDFRTIVDANSGEIITDLTTNITTAESDVTTTEEFADDER